MTIWHNTFELIKNKINQILGRATALYQFTSYYHKIGES